MARYEGGYVKVWRKMYKYNSVILGDAPLMALWPWMISMATYQDQVETLTFQKIPLKMGELVTTLKEMSSVTGCSIKIIRKRLEVLEKWGMIGIQKATVGGKGGTRITLLKYENYQGNNNDKGTVEGTEEAQNGHCIKNIKNIKNNTIPQHSVGAVVDKPSVPKKKVPKFSTSDMSFAQRWLKFHQDEGIQTKRVKIEDWANSIRLMRERDEVSESDIELMLTSLQNKIEGTQYWDTNSPPGLRIESSSNKQQKHVNLLAAIKRHKRPIGQKYDKCPVCRNMGFLFLSVNKNLPTKAHSCTCSEGRQNQKQHEGKGRPVLTLKQFNQKKAEVEK